MSKSSHSAALKEGQVKNKGDIKKVNIGLHEIKNSGGNF